MKDRYRTVLHHDSELGLVAVKVRDDENLGRLLIIAGLVGALLGVALAIAIVTHTDNKPTGTPTIEEPTK